MNGRLKILILVLVVVSGVRLALAAWDWLEEKAPVPRVAASARIQTGDRAYLSISPEARTRLLEKIKTVKLGDSTEEVYEKMGKPSADLPLTSQPAAKEAGLPSSMMVGSCIVAYYIKQKRADQFDENFDEHIYIFLDEDELVKHIYVLRQDELKPVKYPDPRVLRDPKK